MKRFTTARTHRGKCGFCPNDIIPGEDYKRLSRPATAAEQKDPSLRTKIYRGMIEMPVHKECFEADVEWRRQQRAVARAAAREESSMNDKSALPPLGVRTDNGLLQEMAEEVTEVNIANGWFEASRSFGDDIALLHSEVSEMLEAYRDGKMEGYSYKGASAIPVTVEWRDGAAYFEDGTVVSHDRLIEMGFSAKPEGVRSEAADVLVRLLDTCKRYDIDLFAAWREKLDYNRTRGHRHGGKVL